MLKRLRYYITDKMEMVVPVSRYLTSFTGSLAETPMLRSFTLAWSCKRRVREIKNPTTVPIFASTKWLGCSQCGRVDSTAQRWETVPLSVPFLVSWCVCFLSGKLSGFDFLSQQVAIYTTLMSHSLENLLSSNICEKSCLNIWWVGRPRYGSSPHNLVSGFF